MEEVVNYIVKTYGFEIVPCSIPSSNFQYIKRNFYIWIMKNISEKLFYFIRDKISPIKFLNERPDGSTWLRKRMYDNSLYIIGITREIEIGHYNNYSITLYLKNISRGIVTDCIDFNLVFASIDKILCSIPELKEYSRDNKLKKLLKDV